MFQRIAIIAKPENAVLDTLNAIIEVLNQRHLDVAVEKNSPQPDPALDFSIINESQLGSERDLVITIGGDGTLLRAAQQVFPAEVPLLGVNLGRLGFLTDLSPLKISAQMNAILNGDFIREPRIVLDCEVLRAGEVVATAQGLNDIVIQKWNTARLITFDTYIDGHFVHSQRADGMIASTPTGSTAYALSGGGPIVHPALAAFVLVPICPHALTNRPIVVSDTVSIEMVIGTDREDESRLTCDGNDVSRLLRGDRVKVSKHRNVIELIHPAEHDYFATLRVKLDWSRDPC